MSPGIDGNSSVWPGGGYRGWDAPLLSPNDKVEIVRAQHFVNDYFAVDPLPPSTDPGDNIPKTPRDLAERVDHCALAQTTTSTDIGQLCHEAGRYSFRSVCVNPCWVATARRHLEDSNTLVVSTIGFPLGQSTSRVKAREADAAVQDGASDVDMVADIGALKEVDLKRFFGDISAVVAAVPRHDVIVILETGLLGGTYEKAIAAYTAAHAGAKLVKTSTGFSYTQSSPEVGSRVLGAEPKDVTILAASTPPWVGVKAAGGIRTYQQALHMFRAGATRLGTSKGPLLVNRMSEEQR
jgi:deoxyribose-phosphate aldolase